METNTTNTKTILIVGDSLSKGVSLNEELKRYFFLKESFANNLAKATGDTVVNIGKFGSTVTRGKKRLEKKLEQLKPDLVLVEFGGNDCDFAWDEIADNPFSQHDPKTPLDEYENVLTEMVGMIQKAGAVPVLMTLPPLNAKWFTKGSKEKGDRILKWLEDISKIYWWHERYSAMNGCVASVTGIPLVDARQAFLRTTDYREYICSDGIHPNKNGHQLITSCILDCFNKNASAFKQVHA